MSIPLNEDREYQIRNTLETQPCKDLKDKTYRLLWCEIEYFVRGYKDISDNNHRHIHQNIIDRQKTDNENDSSIYH
ncbi:unnamed protein product, partial [Rotaria sordida]